MNKSLQALGRLKAGQMNGTEQAYSNVLARMQDAGQILWFKFEGIKLRLADKTFYSPDFAVMRDNGQMEIHEVKGRWEDDARVKIKVAADIYPFRFLAVKSKYTKARGWTWEIEEF